MPESFTGQQAGKKKDKHTENGAKNRHVIHVIQQKGYGSPEDRVADTREPRDDRHGASHGRVHDRDRDQINRDVIFDSPSGPAGT